MTSPDLEALAASLDARERIAVQFGKCGVPAGRDENSTDCICAADASENLIPLGLAIVRERFPGGIVLSPLGLQLRAHLQKERT